MSDIETSFSLFKILVYQTTKKEQPLINVRIKILENGSQEIQIRFEKSESANPCPPCNPCGSLSGWDIIKNIPFKV